MKLELGKAIERDLSGGQSHWYQIALVEGEYLHLVVDQRAIDVVVGLYAPDDKKLTEIDWEGAEGPELVSWVAHTTGTHRLEIRSFANEAKPGRYEIKVETLRQATIQDTDRVKAEKSYGEGLVFAAEGTPESLRRALEKLSSALADWRAAGAKQQEAATLNYLGRVYSDLGEKQKALEYFNQALLIQRLVDDRSGEAAALYNIGGVYDSLGEKHKALEYYNQSLPIKRQVGDRSGEASTLNNIGAVYDSVGEKQKALEYFNQAMVIQQQLGDRSAGGPTLSNIGLVYDSLGEKEKALEYYDQALVISQQVGDRSGEAATLNNIGLVYDSLGENQKAMEYYNQALLIMSRIGDRKGEARSLSNIGGVYSSLGEKRKALEYYTRAMPIMRQGGDPGGEAMTLNSIGSVYDSLGEKQKALDYYYQALPITRRVWDRGREGATLNNIGLLYSSVGEKQKALQYYDQALLIRRQIRDRSGEAVTLNNIGGVYYDLGGDQKALDYFNQALPIMRQVRNRSGEARTLNNIGAVFLSLGEKQKALEHYKLALPIRREVGDRSGEATTLHNIGRVYDSLGEEEKALEQYNLALPIRREVGDRSGEETTLSSIAAVYREKGILEEARTNIEAALNIVESLRANVVRQELRLAYTSSVQGRYAFYVDLLMQMHKSNPLSGFDSTALKASERGRARSLLEMLNESHANIKQGVDPNLLDQEWFVQQLLNTKAERLTRLMSGKHTEEQAAVARKEVDDLTEQFHVIQAQIREKSPHYAALTQPQPLSLEEIQKLLEPDTLLLEYSLGKERSYLWAVSQDSYTSYELPKGSEIEAAAKLFYESLRSPGPIWKSRRRSTRSERVYTLNQIRQAEELPRQLSTMLLSPVASILGEKRLVIVPDGALHYLPFGALANPSRPRKWEPLILRHEIVSLPSATALAIQRKELDGREAAPKTAIGFADPVFSNDDGRVNPARNQRSPVKVEAAKHVAAEQDEPLYLLALTRAAHNTGHRTTREALPRLPGTRLEGQEIVKLAGTDQSKLIVDFAANRTAAESEELSQYRYVHFGTHGLLDSQNPELSALVLSLVDEHGRTQDGYLRAHHVFNLNLPAEVVVLSACETGLGKDVRGEGLVGITRGFMYAGAKRVVVSLWSVNDRSTAELMTEFYRGMLKDGKRPAAALRAAQIKMLTDAKMKRWRSPYYWAPFILQGEWR